MEGDFQGIKVMVIDDSKTIRRTAETLLSKVGCDVVTAVDGFDALAKIADTRPSIIFVDIMMPRLDGYQTCALIKNNSVLKHTPVIMLSSKDGLFDRAKGRIVGSDQYLTKPFSKDELLTAIRDHVGSVRVAGGEMSKVLLVDDSPTEIYRLRGMLEDLSYEVITAENGRDGVALASAEQPDIVLMDIVMPRYERLLRRLGRYVAV